MLSLMPNGWGRVGLNLGRHLTSGWLGVYRTVMVQDISAGVGPVKNTSGWAVRMGPVELAQNFNNGEGEVGPINIRGLLSPIIDSCGCGSIALLWDILVLRFGVLHQREAVSEWKKLCFLSLMSSVIGIIFLDFLFNTHSYISLNYCQSTFINRTNTK